MRLRIVHKLFIALILISTVSLIVLGGVTHWSLGRGFLHYVNQVEKKRFERLAEGLAEEYRIEGSWEPLKNDPSRFRGILRNTMRAEGPGQRQFERRPPGPGSAPGIRPPPEGRFPPHRVGGWRHIPGRMTLYDASRHPILGNPVPEQPETMLAIDVDDQTVGWLSFRRLRKPAAAPDVDFLRQQSRILLLSVVGLGGLAALLAVLFARQLSKPIGAITESIEKLAAGQYGVRLIPTSNDELGGLATDVNHLAATLEENESARRRWIADVSHELRTPIAVLRGEVEAVQDGIRAKDENFLRSIGFEVQRLEKLIEDLYQLSMSDVGALDYRFEACSVSAVLEQTITEFQGRLDECGITLQSVIQPDVTYQADRQRLAQLFANVLENSCRYTERPGQLLVELSTGPESISVDVVDSGPGLSADEASHLFDPLYRGERSRSREHGGAGLGLSICRKIVEAHRGTITAQPSHLGGVAIHIRFPAPS